MQALEETNEQDCTQPIVVVTEECTQTQVIEVNDNIEIASDGEPMYVHQCAQCLPVQSQYKMENETRKVFREKPGQLPLRKKTFTEKLHRFDSMIRDRQTMAGLSQIDDPVHELLTELYKTPAFKAVRSTMVGEPMPSNAQTLVRVLCSQYKDPTLLLEKNGRQTVHADYDEEYSCEEES